MQAWPKLELAACPPITKFSADVTSSLGWKFVVAWLKRTGFSQASSHICQLLLIYASLASAAAATASPQHDGTGWHW